LHWVRRGFRRALLHYLGGKAFFAERIPAEGTNLAYFIRG